MPKKWGVNEDIYPTTKISTTIHCLTIFSPKICNFCWFLLTPVKNKKKYIIFLWFSKVLIKGYFYVKFQPPAFSLSKVSLGGNFNHPPRHPPPTNSSNVSIVSESFIWYFELILSNIYVVVFITMFKMMGTFIYYSLL